MRPKADRFKEEALPHMDSLYRTAMLMTRDETEAQDLVQDTYLRAYENFGKFTEGTNCKAWLYTILKNIFINDVVHNQKKPEMVSLSVMRRQGIDLPIEGNPEDEVFGDLLDDEIIAALNSLDDIFRKAVLLADLGGLSYEQMSDVMGCPTGTVMSRLHRGRRLLRERLRNYAAQRGYF